MIQPPIKTFSPDHWAQPLTVPPGTRYVEADTVDDVAAALARGLATHSVSCGGHVFIWRAATGAAFIAEHFFHGPPARSTFDSAEDAAAFASSCSQ